MSTPHVSGSLALLLSHEPKLTAKEAIERVLTTGMKIDRLEGRSRTASTLDAYAMLSNKRVEPIKEEPLRECRIHRFKRCKRGCNQEFPRRRRKRSECKGQCRDQHDCPITFKNLFLEYTTWSE